MSNDKSFAKAMFHLCDKVDAESLDLLLIKIAFYHARQERLVRDVIRNLQAQQASILRTIEMSELPSDGPDERDSIRARLEVVNRGLHSVIRTELFRMYEQEVDEVRVLKEKYGEKK